MDLSKQKKKSSLPIYMSSLLLMVSLLIAWASDYFNQNMQEIYTKNQYAFGLLMQRYHAIDDTKNKIDKFLPRVRQLYQQGIIGAVNRPNFIDAINQAKRKIPLDKLTYEISARKKFTTEFELDKGSFEIFSSTMRLQLSLLHEGDLQTLFTELKNNAQGIFSISQCTLLRNTETINTTAEIANINGTCLLEWISVELPDEPLIL